MHTYLSAGWQVLGFLPDYLDEERLSSGSGFFILSLLTYLSGGAALPVTPYLAATVIILAGIALFVSFRSWPADDGYLTGSLILAIAFFVLVTPHYSWYFLWLLPLLCLVPYWPALVLTTASFVLYFALEDRSPARELLVNSLLYGSFFLAASIHLCLHRWRSLATTQAKSQAGIR